MKRIPLLEDYVREYGQETDRVRNHRYTWDNWKAHPDEGVTFYQGIRTYFNPDWDYPDGDCSDKKTDYHAIARVLNILVESKVSQKEVASFCGLNESNLSHWKTMRNRPNKYQWWAIAVEVKLPYDLIPAFLLMIGEVIEPMRMEDQIIYSQMKKEGGKCSRFSVGVALSEEPSLDEKVCKDALKAFGVID